MKKGLGEVSCCGMMVSLRAKEAVAALMNDVWHSADTDFGYVSSKARFVKFKFIELKVCVVMVVYDHTEGGMLKKGRGPGTT